MNKNDDARFENTLRDILNPVEGGYQEKPQHIRKEARESENSQKKMLSRPVPRIIEMLVRALAAFIALILLFLFALQISGR